jgi:hypothetical protein
MNSYNGFYKVNEDNGGVCIGTFYNPATKESFTKITWDIDNIRLEDDDYIQTLRYLPLNKDARKEWLYNNGIIQEGDKVEVVKGRKVPLGIKATVTMIKPYYDCHHRWQCDYVYLDNGMKTNINNCKIV